MAPARRTTARLQPEREHGPGQRRNTCASGQGYRHDRSRRPVLRRGPSLSPSISPPASHPPASHPLASHAPASHAPASHPPASHPLASARRTASEPARPRERAPDRGLPPRARAHQERSVQRARLRPKPARSWLRWERAASPARARRPGKGGHIRHHEDQTDLDRRSIGSSGALGVGRPHHRRRPLVLRPLDVV